VSGTTGEEIPLYIYDHFAPAFTVPEVLTFIASASAGQNDRSRLCEVTYSHTASGGNAYLLTRRLVADRTGSDTENAAWDFFGKPAGWESTADAGDTFQEVIAGVESIEITCYDTNGNVIDTAHGDYPELTYLPAYVRITVTVFDEGLIGLSTQLGAAWQKRVDQTKRTFSKLVFLTQRS
jgi:hypothetical protein